MFTYTLIKIHGTDDFTINCSDGWSIPSDIDNTDYQRFKVDLADGAELLDAEGNVIDGKEYVKTLP